MTQKMHRVDNTTLASLNLPGMTFPPAKPGGEPLTLLPLELVCGENDIEVIRLEALNKDKSGLGEYWRFLTKGTRGKRARVEILSKAESAERVGKPNGPLPPESLAEWSGNPAKDKVALDLVAVTDDVEALERWSSDERPQVAAAARTKAAQLRAGAPGGEAA